MNEELKKSVDLFIENEVAIQNSSFWESQENDFICALEYSSEGLNVDVEKMKAAKKIIDSNTGVLSEFRGHTYLIMTTQMALSDDMEAYFNHVKEIYDLIVKGKWFGIEYYILEAMLIAQHTNGDFDKAKEITEKASSIYASMKKNHPWLTGEEDLGLATLLAISGLKEEDVVKEMEESYRILKDSIIGSRDAIQTLSQILSLKIGNTKEKCDKVISINNSLKENNKKFGSSFELSILGVLAFIDVDSETLAKEISEVYDYLKSQKGAFGILGVGNKQILMYSGILVMQQYCKQEMNNTANTLAIVIATQVAILMAIIDDMMVTNMIMLNTVH